LLSKRHNHMGLVNPQQAKKRLEGLKPFFG